MLIEGLKRTRDRVIKRIQQRDFQCIFAWKFPLCLSDKGLFCASTWLEVPNGLKAVFFWLTAPSWTACPSEISTGEPLFIRYSSICHFLWLHCSTFCSALLGKRGWHLLDRNILNTLITITWKHPGNPAFKASPAMWAWNTLTPKSILDT